MSWHDKERESTDGAHTRRDILRVVPYTVGGAIITHSRSARGREGDFTDEFQDRSLEPYRAVHASLDHWTIDQGFDGPAAYVSGTDITAFLLTDPDQYQWTGRRSVSIDFMVDTSNWKRNARLLLQDGDDAWIITAAVQGDWLSIAHDAGMTGDWSSVTRYEYSIADHEQHTLHAQIDEETVSGGINDTPYLMRHELEGSLQDGAVGFGVRGDITLATWFDNLRINGSTTSPGDPPGENGEPNAVITAFETDGGQVAPGDVVESTVTVENTGGVEHTFFVGYSMVSADGQEFHNDGSTGTPLTLEPGEQETVIVSWIVPDDAPTTTYDAVTAVWEESSAADLETQLDTDRNEDAVTVGSEDLSVEITFENNFETESTEEFLGSLYNEVRRAVPIEDPTLPDKNAAYIHVDLRVEFPDRDPDSIVAVRPYFTHEFTDETFSASTLDHLDDSTDLVEIPDIEPGLAEFEPGVYGWDNFRIRAPAQVTVQMAEVVAFLLGSHLQVGEVTNPLEARTEAYPDVYLTELEIEYETGDVETVDVDERIPRYDDVCTSVGFSGLFNDRCPLDGKFDSYQSGTMVMSPAAVAIEDRHGRITGRIWEDGEYVRYDQIPGALYSGPLRHEFVLAPEGEHQIIIDGEDDGTATIVVDQLTDDGKRVQTEQYHDVDVSATTRLQRSLDTDADTDTTTFTVDRDRTGTPDEEFAPDQSDTVPATEHLDSRFETSIGTPNTGGGSGGGGEGGGNGGSGGGSGNGGSGGSGEGGESSIGGGQEHLYGYELEEIAAGGAVTAGLAYLLVQILNGN